MSPSPKILSCRRHAAERQAARRFPRRQGLRRDDGGIRCRALEQIAKHKPDLVLLDVVMPGLSGYDVCRRIRETPATATLPVVMITALDPGTGAHQRDRSRRGRLHHQADQPA